MLEYDLIYCVVDLCQEPLEAVKALFFYSGLSLAQWCRYHALPTNQGWMAWQWGENEGAWSHPSIANGPTPPGGGSITVRSTSYRKRCKSHGSATTPSFPGECF